MKQAAAFLGVIITLAVGYFVYREELAPQPGHPSTTLQQVDTVGVTSDLLAIGQAERLYLASHGSYGSVEQLQADGDIAFSGVNRRGCNFTADVDGGQHFRITATPADPAKSGPALSVDETMEVKKP